MRVGRRRIRGRAMIYIADDVALDAPAGRLTGSREFLGPFAEQVLIRAELIAGRPVRCQ
ncbi:hypothetical protein [Rugosimonospora acidiphila]